MNEQGRGDGNPLTIAGVVYEKGLGTHAPAEVAVYLGRRRTSFSAALGLDDEITRPGSVAFRITGDGNELCDSGVVRPGPAGPVAVDVTGVRSLVLAVTDGGDGKNFDHAGRAEAKLTRQS